MVRYYCDRCGNEVENLDALMEFSIDVTERPNRSLWHWRAEVCQECYEAIASDRIPSGADSAGDTAHSTNYRSGQAGELAASLRVSK